MTSLCLVVQLADRTSILSKGSFSVIIIDISLFSNHSPSEWFSLYKKAALPGRGQRCLCKPYCNGSFWFTQESIFTKSFPFGTLKLHRTVDRTKPGQQPVPSDSVGTGERRTRGPGSAANRCRRSSRKRRASEASRRTGRALNAQSGCRNGGSNLQWFFPGVFCRKGTCKRAN